MTMIVQELGSDIKLVGIKKFALTNDAILFPLYKGSGYVGILNIKPNTRITITSNSERYTYNSKNNLNNLLFILYGNNPKIIVSRKSFLIKKYYHETSENYIIKLLKGDLSDYGSWLSIGHANHMLEIWPINIKWPNTCIIRLWSKFEKKAILEVKMEDYITKIDLPLRNIGIINASDYLLLIFDKIKNVRLTFLNISFDPITLTEIS